MVDSIALFWYLEVMKKLLLLIALLTFYLGSSSINSSVSLGDKDEEPDKEALPPGHTDEPAHGDGYEHEEPERRKGQAGWWVAFFGGGVIIGTTVYIYKNQKNKH